MTVQTQLQLISADSHINEPPDLWTSRLPAQYSDRAPRMQRFEQGDAWVMEGASDPINFGANSNAGLSPDERPHWITWESVRPGGYDPAARLQEQDQDGVDLELMYPTPRVSRQLFWHTDDKAFHLACIRAYNDWLAEFCSYDTDRLGGIALLPNVGVDDALAELERAMALPGMRGVTVGRYPHGDNDLEPDDDRLWGALSEAGIPLAIHVGLVDGPAEAKEKGKSTNGSLRIFDAPLRVVQFVESGVFDRFPDLALVLVEVDSGWLPYVAEQMDDRFKRTRSVLKPDIERLPSEYFATNIYSTFITDSYGVRNRHAIGVSQMMWSSDYPHSGADWPHSWDTINAHFADVPEDEKHAILAGNAARLYPKR
jgi:predicted TIM-barrel fold metal-dependent hydrolase